MAGRRIGREGDAVTPLVCVAVGVSLVAIGLVVAIVVRAWRDTDRLLRELGTVDRARRGWL